MTIEMQTTIEHLTADSVGIRRQEHMIRDGENSPVGDAHRVSFVNSKQGRKQLHVHDMEDKHKLAILTVWGETPTVIEDLPLEPAEESEVP